MAQQSKDTNNGIKKDTVYIDIDDEITTIIEKVNNSTAKIVALVLPKRASVLQSIVNLKLLKRSAENAKKHVVLITSEASLLPLAGAVSMHVASSLQSKPAIPVAPDAAPREQVINEETGEEYEDFDTDAAASEPIGKLAGVGTGAAAARPANAFTEPETIELDDDEPDATAGAAVAGGAAVAAKKGKDKKLKIPDFKKFRILVVAGVALLLLLIGGFVYANVALAKATITIRTDSTDINTKANLTLDPKATELDLATDTIPTKIETKTQTGTQQVSTSGEKNNGTRASGTISVSQVCKVKPAPIDAGTGYSAGNLTFISTQQLQLNPSGGFDSDGNIVCKGDVDVSAQQPGTKFNVPAGTKFTVAGNPAASGVNGAAFAGGTDNIVKVVAQADIESAKNKLAAADSNSVKTELTNKLKDADFTALPDSLQAGEPTITPSAAVGDQVDTVTVTSSTVYTLYGFRKTDVKAIVTATVKEQIDESKQRILRDGVDTAKYVLASPANGGPLQVTLTASSLAGPDIKESSLKQQLAGKKSGEAETIVGAIPGVKEVTVKYSPFWISKVPGKESKVDIVVVKASGETTKLESGQGSGGN